MDMKTFWKRLLATAMAVSILMSTANLAVLASGNEPTCGKKEHIHSDECFAEKLICGMEEREGTEGHTHGDDCYTVTEERLLICQPEETKAAEEMQTGEPAQESQEETDPEEEVHVHNEECYTVVEKRTLTCQVEESNGTEGHTHGEECREKELVCQQEEHQHTGSCFVQAQEEQTGDQNADTEPQETEETSIVYPVSYTENNINYELYEDGTAKVISGEKDTWYRIIVPGAVTYKDNEYRVTVIGEKAFYDKGRAQVTLSEGLETIEKYAFGYTYLYGKDLVIPDSVTSIGEFAFYGFHTWADETYHIEKITFGKNLRTIENQAFYYKRPASGFVQVEVECYANLESIHKWAFPYNYDKATYTLTSGVSTITIHDAYDGALDAVLNVSYGLQPDYGVKQIYPLGVDQNNITNVDALQRAINDAEDNVPTTLTLNSAYLMVKDSIIIPAGKDIILKDGGTEVVFECDDYMFSKPMFIIEKGGRLTVDATAEESLIINGAPLAKPGRLTAMVFQVNGELVLNQGLINGGGGLGMGMGMFSGAIVLGDNARFTMTGGILRGTSTDGAHGAPVVVASGAEFLMSGGKITENTNITSSYNGYAAGAVLVYGWNDGDVGGKMTLTGDAEICGNSTAGVGGAITLVGNAELYMDGGRITGNRSEGGSNSNGGGVCVAGRTGGMSQNFDAKCVFTMDGGEISNNEACYGGGIYVNSNYVTLNVGLISGNKASMTGGGVYVETPEGSLTGAKVNNAVIYGNTATYMGGGMYFCPTGSVTLSAYEGVGVFDNHATNDKAAGDDFVSVVPTMNATNKFATLVARMLGGGKIDWYLDGQVTETAMSGWGHVVNDSVRYSESTALVAPGTYDYSLALKAIVTDGAKQLAMDSAKLVITGNTAQRGGGIGSNGKITAGDVDRKEWNVKVNARKMWDGIAEAEWEPVTFRLMIGSYAVETVTLSAENNWSWAFVGLPRTALGSISISEVTGGYSVSMDTEVNDAEETINITVTNAPATEVTVKKVWSDGAEAHENDSVSVQLYDNGTASGDPVTLNSENSWTYAWADLPTRDHIYTVGEVNVPEGYTVSIDGESAMEGTKTIVTVTITNTRKPEPPSTTYTSLTVRKTWEGDKEANRPTAIQVQLYRNGRAYGNAVTLSGDSGWNYTWSGLDSDDDWTVGEINVPQGYTATTSRVGRTVTITNRYTETEKPSPTPTPSETPTPTPTPEETLPSKTPPLSETTPPETESPEPEPEEKLPEEEPPLAELPGEEEELGDNDTPLANVPQTGDRLWLWLMLTACSAAGLVGISLSEKRGKRVV